MSLTPNDCEIMVLSQEAARVTADTGSPSICTEILLKCCEENWRFSNTAASCAASLCQVEAVNSTDSGSFRTLWLKKLQSLFLRKLSFVVWSSGFWSYLNVVCNFDYTEITVTAAAINVFLAHQHKAAGVKIRLSKNNDHDGVSHGVECSQEGDRIPPLKSDREMLLL